MKFERDSLVQHNVDTLSSAKKYSIHNVKILNSWSYIILTIYLQDSNVGYIKLMNKKYCI